MYICKYKILAILIWRSDCQTTKPSNLNPCQNFQLYCTLLLASLLKEWLVEDCCCFGVVLNDLSDASDGGVTNFLLSPMCELLTLL